MKKEFLVTGANFMNKGAQAMLFVTVSELRSRYPGCRITMTTWERLGKIPFDFRYISDSLLFCTVMNKEYSTAKKIRIFINACREKNYELIRAFLYGIRFRRIDAVIDISGYQLSSQWGYQASKNYIHRIAVARDNGVPFFIMPQSLSPFHYGSNQIEMDSLIKEYLAYPRIIYAREQSGYEVLTGEYGLKNVQKSVDLVLQNRSIDEKLLYRGKYQKRRYLQITTDNNVAIIPNARLFEQGCDEERLLTLYRDIILMLRRSGKNIYLVMHSAEDFKICRFIRNQLQDRNAVHIVKKDMDCLEFNQFIQRFDYVIGSRYHAIVHAYKNSVPCIVLGWADKYRELLKQFGQEKYMFDVRADIDQDAVLQSVINMENQWITEKKMIESRLREYQKENCFDIVSLMLD